ncbi:MAG: four-helix bundle copper-binding protein [Cyclobacteriaceae bacterium]
MMKTTQQDFLRRLHDCISACQHCSEQCLHEENIGMMVKCIQLDRDCADICTLTANLVARNSSFAQHMARQCAEICQQCASECGRHEHEHCQECAQACQLCQEACVSYANT